MSACKMLLVGVVLLVALEAVRCELEAFNIPREISQHKNFKLLNRTCGARLPQPRVVGGKEASLGEFPWIARIGYVNTSDIFQPVSFRCAGSIISEEYILTAAHCIFPTSLFVRVGEHDERTTEDCDKSGCLPPPQDIAICSVKCHEHFGESGNDICIIRLAKKLNFSVSVQPICLPFYNEILGDYLPGKMLEVAGWGVHKYDTVKGRIVSPVLLKLSIPAVDKLTCIRGLDRLNQTLDGNLQQTLSHDQICAGGERFKDSCSGDSGGPLMKSYALNGRLTSFLLGIVSWGSPFCGLPEVPGVYTDVRYHWKWILDNLPTN